MGHQCETPCGGQNSNAHFEEASLPGFLGPAFCLRRRVVERLLNHHLFCLDERAKHV